MSREDRTGKRTPREKFRRRVPDLGHYFIVTDTAETEKNYITGLKEALPKALQNRIVIKISSTKTSRLVNECLEQAANDPQYGQPWIVFDRDKVPNFDKMIEKALQNGVHVGWSNPCIEIWFDAYFGKCISMPILYPAAKVLAQPSSRKPDRNTGRPISSFIQFSIGMATRNLQLNMPRPG